MIIDGEVQKIDLDKRTFQIKDASGNPHILLFSKTADLKGVVKLREIKIGEEVVVTVIKGRAEAVEIKRPKFEKP